MDNPSGIDTKNPGFSYGVRYFNVTEAGAIGPILQRLLEQDAAFVANLMELGAVYVNGARIEAREHQLRDGDFLRAHTSPRRYPMAELTLSRHIVFENSDFLILNKPAGYPVHALVDNSQENLLAAVSKYIGAPAGITHRLDIGTEGLLLYAKNSEFQKLFNGYLRDGRVKKLYRARVHGTIAAVDLLHFMEPSPVAPKVVSRSPREGWLECRLRILEAQAIAERNRADKQDIPDGQVMTDLLIELQTGRSQQIRAQLSDMGNPIVGDVRYGSSRALAGETDSFALQACSLEFPENFKFQLAAPEWSTRA